MRLIAAFLFLASLSVVLPSAGSAKERGEVHFVRIWPQWREAASFVRISEYFGGEENTGRQTMLRSQPGERTGFYFLTRVRNDHAPLPGAKFVLEVITSDSTRTKTYTFPANVPSGGHVFNLGLTGTDYANKDTQPVAWRLRLLDEHGNVVASHHSFLWSESAQ